LSGGLGPVGGGWLGGWVVLLVFCAFVALFALLLPTHRAHHHHPLFFCGKWQQRNLRLLVNAAAATIKKEAARVKAGGGGAEGLRGFPPIPPHDYHLLQPHTLAESEKCRTGAIVKAGNSLI